MAIDVVIANPNLHPDLLVYPAAGDRLVPDAVLIAQRQDVRLGAGAYSGSMLASLGRTVAYLDSVGDDIFGQFTVNTLEQMGHDVRWIERYVGDHMVVVSVADDHSRGGTMIGTCPVAWQRTIEQIAALLRGTPRASATYIWSWFWSYSNRNLTDAATAALVQPLRDRTGVVLLDPNWKPAGDPPAHDVRELRAALRLVDVLKLNHRDAAILLSSGSDPRERLAQLLDLGPRMVVMTLGPSGCAVVDQSDRRVRLLPALPVEPRDTTGAGDHFGAAVLHAILRGDSPLEAAAFAGAAAGLAIARDAAKPLPTLEEIEDAARSVRPGPSA